MGSMRTVSRIVPLLVAIAKEPPFRRLAKPLIRALCFAGELLAIDEFNREAKSMKID